jgi:multiple sugar transport system substrate-binding protein
MIHVPSKRVVALIAAVSVVALLGAIAARAASGMSARSSSTTITVWTMEDSTKFTQLLQGFTKQTGIKVHVDAIPWANVNDKLTTAVASGHGPDVVQIGLSELSSFIAAKALLNLKPYLAAHPALADKNYPKGIASTKINPKGRMLSVPWVSDVRVLFYRKDILAQAGIKGPPATWAQLFADAKKLAARGGNNYGYYIPQWDSALPVEWTWDAGGTVLDKHGKVTFDTPAFRKAANFYWGFYRAKLVPAASDFDQTQGFISGAAPMLISGPYLQGLVDGAAPQLKGKYGVAPLPSNRTHTSLFAGSNMGVWYNTKHAKESLRLLDYLAQPATQLQWFKSAAELPTNLAALNSKSLTSDPFVKVYTKQLQNAWLLPPLVPAWNKIAGNLLDTLNSVALNGANASDALNKLNQEVAAAQQ